jgi:hypothetical protein
MTDNPSDAFPPGSPLSFIKEGLAAGRRLSIRAAAGRSPFIPPPDLARVLLRLKGAAGVGGANILNQAELFTGGYCEACKQPQGARSDASLRIRFIDAYSWRYGGGLAQVRFDQRISVTLLYFSEDFLTLLTPQEQAQFYWRPVENLGKGKKPMHELIGSRLHVPLAALRGGNPDTPQCHRCGWRRQPQYDLVRELPAWLDPEDDGKRRDQPDLYINVQRLPTTDPKCFTIGDWRDAVKLVFTADRWTEIKKQKGASGVQAWDVGVVAPEVIEEPGLL